MVPLPDQCPNSGDVIIRAPTATAIASADSGTGTDTYRLEITSDSAVGMRGYTSAVQRFAGAVTRCAVDGAADVHIAPFEALTWLDSLAEGDKGVIGAKLAGDYDVCGLRFLRGRVHHHWAQAIYPSDTGDWLWQGLDVLPLAPEKHAGRGGQKAYTARLERRPVLASLQHVERYCRPPPPPLAVASHPS
jgi:hypothetical protein